MSDPKCDEDQDQAFLQRITGILEREKKDKDDDIAASRARLVEAILNETG